ncbi:MAG: Rossmann-like and DUF2520 domain-containing protein [Bacteroidota bacterium]
MFPKIAFIGSGKVAWHLSQALENAGLPVVEVYSRQPANAQKLVNQLYDASIRTQPDFSDSAARLFFIAVSDDSMAIVASELILPPDSTVVHTSGTHALDDLQYALASDVQAGVFYPLQTFSSGRAVDFSIIPLCIEAYEPPTESLLIDIAQRISQTVYVVSSEERRILHIAAVFACNFTNHLLAISKRILDNENLEFALLKPLIEETIQKALQSNDPAEVQTGPAQRHDTQIIRKHLAYLQDTSETQTIYRTLTNSIMSSE